MGTHPPSLRVVHKIARRDVAFRHRPPVRMCKFPHVSSRFMDNLEPGSSSSQTSSVWNSVAEWIVVGIQPGTFVELNIRIKHTENTPLFETVAVVLRFVREQCAILPFLIPSLSRFEMLSWTATARHCDMLHGADTGSTPSTGNPIKSKRIAPFTAESYEPHCRRVGGPSIKFACSVNLNYYTVALVDAVCIYMMYFARYPGFFLFFKCFSTRMSLTRNKPLGST